uniref:Cytochrome c oxidase assembly factor 6 n=1 Tax=Anopheles epiroticus TaxID=199890 RepID=A0A182PFZ6_9DIPT
MSFPDKDARAKCWTARDEYWACLDKHAPEYQCTSQEPEPKECIQLRKLYQQGCPAQWVKHFDRKRTIAFFYRNYVPARYHHQAKDPFLSAYFGELARCLEHNVCIGIGANKISAQYPTDTGSSGIQTLCMGFESARLAEIFNDDRQGSFIWNLLFGTERQYVSLGRLSYRARSITPSAELVSTSALDSAGTPRESSVTTFTPYGFSSLRSASAHPCTAFRVAINTVNPSSSLPEPSKINLPRVGLSSPMKARAVRRQPITLFLNMFSHCSESCESMRPRYTDPAVLITASMPRSPAFRWAPIDSAASRSTSSRVTSIFIGTTEPLTGVSEFSRIFIQPRSNFAGNDSTGSFIPANTRCPLLAKNVQICKTGRPGGGEKGS